MAGGTYKLSARTVSSSNAPGRYGDGGGLYLQVGPTGTKSWIFRFMLTGKAREMGLGAVADVSLADARTKASEARKLAKDGIDPIEHRDADREATTAATRQAAARAKTFRQCAEAYIESHQAGWRSAKHRYQWAATLQTYAYPVLGDVPVQAVDLPLVLKVLEPIWATKTETASRVRGRIEAILDWARVREYRQGENPARWRGQLSHMLPPKRKVVVVDHHSALPYAVMGEFMAELRIRDAIAARALEFTILTAARTGEVIGALWDEIDMDGATWTIPGERMKAGKEHRVPLSEPALAILRTMSEHRLSDFVFPSERGTAMSNMSMLMLLRRMKRKDLTAHGFRSSFRDWAAERTAYPSEVVEMALAHTVGNKVEAAYRRGDLFDKRARLMSDWAAYCNAAPMVAGGVVVPLRAVV
ncbi:MAG: integrase arm-type DNA-binding domain-containing protein [Rhodospirillaceae bacterium]